MNDDSAVLDPWAAVVEHAERQPSQCALSVLGRDYTWSELRRRAAALAGGLQASDLGEGRCIALALPNIVDLALLVLASGIAGTRLEAVDPRAAAPRLAEALSAHRADAVATANIGQLFDRVRAAADATGELPVLVARMTDGLPFPRNLLLPLLRGAGLATVPAEPRFLRLRALAESAPVVQGPAAADARLSAEAAAILPDLPDRGSVLFARMTTCAQDLAAMLAIFSKGLTLILAPRFDEKGLALLSQRHQPVLALCDEDSAARLPKGLACMLRRGL